MADAIWLTEAGTGRRISIPHEDLESMSDETADPEHYGMHKVPWGAKPRDRTAEDWFPSRYNDDLTEIYVESKAKGYIVLHSMDEIANALRDQVEDIHMNPALISRFHEVLNVVGGIGPNFFMLEHFGTDKATLFHCETCETFPTTVDQTRERLEAGVPLGSLERTSDFGPAIGLLTLSRGTATGYHPGLFSTIS